MNKKLISQFLDNMLEGKYKNAESNARAIIEEKLDKRFSKEYKNFLAKNKEK